MYTLNARLQQFLLAVTAIALVTHMTVVRAADDRAIGIGGGGSAGQGHHHGTRQKLRSQRHVQIP